MNKHTFTTVEDDESRGFVSRIINSRGFISSITSSRVYTAIIDGFHVTSTLIGKFDSNLRIVVSTIKSAVRISTSIVIAPIIIAVDYTMMGLTSRFPIVIASTLRFVPIFKMFKKMGTATIVLANIITTKLVSMGNFVVNVLGISPIVITGTMTCKKYYKVYEWDSWLLSDLDSKTLWEMDYQVV